MRLARIVAVSDLHGHLPRVPTCDLLLLAGDLCPRSNHDVTFQAAWLDGPFREWLDAVPAATVVGVAGNHDFVFERARILVPSGLRWQYLEDESTTALGLTIYGTPWQPRFHDWAFNADPPKMRAVAARIPSDADVLVMHGPPQGYGDRARRYDAPASSPTGCMAPSQVAYEHVGCPHLLARVTEIDGLKLAVFGHIHSGHGVYRLGRDRRPDRDYDTLLANVSLVDERYNPVYDFTLFDLDLDTRRIVRYEDPQSGISADR